MCLKHWNLDYDLLNSQLVMSTLNFLPHIYDILNSILYFPSGILYQVVSTSCMIILYLDIVHHYYHYSPFVRTVITALNALPDSIVAISSILSVCKPKLTKVKAFFYVLYKLINSYFCVCTQLQESFKLR